MPFLMIAWGFIRSGFASALTFFSKPPGAYVGIAIAFALSLWWFGQHEFNRGVLKCETAHAEAAANEIARQKTVVVAVNKASDIRTAKSDVINKSNEKVIIHVKDQAEAMPGASDECISSAIADELRALK